MSDQSDIETSPLSFNFTPIFLFAPLELRSQRSIRLKKKIEGVSPSPPPKLSLWLLYFLALKMKTLRSLETSVTTNNHSVTSQKIRILKALIV